MFRICTKCGEEKQIERFVKQKGKYRPDPYRQDCKDCKNKARRTGKNRKSFEKGHIPWNKGNIKVYLKSLRPKIGYGKTRCTFNYREWKRKVFERDGEKCVKCGNNEKLHCHHIIPWKENEALRFDLDNGMTLCISCHMRIEGKNRIPWNKGLKGVCVAWNKGVPCVDEVKKKISEKLKSNPVRFWKDKKRSKEDKEKMKLSAIKRWKTGS